MCIVQTWSTPEANDTDHHLLLDAESSERLLPLAPPFDSLPPAPRQQGPPPLPPLHAILLTEPAGVNYILQTNKERCKN